MKWHNSVVAQLAFSAPGPRPLPPAVLPPKEHLGEEGVVSGCQWLAATLHFLPVTVYSVLGYTMSVCLCLPFGSSQLVCLVVPRLVLFLPRSDHHAPTPDFW